MNTCDEHQIALEQRRRGALDAVSTLELEAHLAGCEACRRYASAGDRVDEAMHTATAQLAGSLDWEAVTSSMKRRAREHARTPILMGAVGLVIVAALAWRGYQVDDYFEAAMAAGLGVAMLGIASRHLRFKAKLLEGAVADGPGAGLPVYRRLLEDSLSQTRTGRWMVIGITGVLAAVGTLLIVRGDPLFDVIFTWAQVALFSWSAVRTRREYAANSREYALLSR